MASKTFMQRASVWFDAIWICGSGIISFELRRWFGESPQGQPFAATEYLVISAITSLLVWSMIGLNQRSTVHASRGDVILIAGVAISGPLIGLTSTFFLYRSDDVARSIPVFHTLLVFLGLVGLRAFARLFLAKAPLFGARALGDLDNTSVSPPLSQNRQASNKILVVGHARNVATYLRALETVHGTHFEVAGVLVSETGLSGCSIRNAPILGHPDSLSAVIEKLRAQNIKISQVIVANGAAQLSTLISDFLAASNIAIFDFDGLFSESETLSTLANCQPKPYGLKPGPRSYAPLKRAIDILVSGVGLIIASPIIMLTAVLVRFVLGAPVIFWQWRPGLNGRPFKLVKFRSMRNPIDRRGQVLSDEARLGMFGKLLRRSRFDELPQLFNILMGDMSLIGPRPLIQEQQERGGPRLAVRPGLSGWAQVHGGHLVADEQKLAMDLWYVERSSLWLDIKILFLTVRVIILGDQPELAKVESEPKVALANPARSNKSDHTR